MFRVTFRRLLALDDPPERTALTFTIGVFIAFSPFLGFHTILATLIAFLFRFNKIAIYSGTFRDFYQQSVSDSRSHHHCVLRDRGFYSGTPVANFHRRYRPSEKPALFDRCLLSQSVSRVGTSFGPSRLVARCFRWFVRLLLIQ